MTINETKEVLVHLYAYCGFPRSIMGLRTLLKVLNDRKEKGLLDLWGEIIWLTGKTGELKQDLVKTGQKLVPHECWMAFQYKNAGACSILRYLKDQLFQFSKDYQMI